VVSELKDDEIENQLEPEQFLQRLQEESYPRDRMDSRISSNSDFEDMISFTLPSIATTLQRESNTKRAPIIAVAPPGQPPAPVYGSLNYMPSFMQMMPQQVLPFPCPKLLSKGPPMMGYE